MIHYFVRHYGVGANVAYVRKKIVKGREYFQLVENHRVDGKPRQKVLLHLGQYQTAEHALEGWDKDLAKLRSLISEEQGKASENPELGTTRRLSQKRLVSAEKRAEILETNLNKLRELRDSGVV